MAQICNLYNQPINLEGALTGNANKIPLLGDTSQLVGDARQLCGSVNGLRGDVSFLSGNVTNVTGDASGIKTWIPVGKPGEPDLYGHPIDAGIAIYGDLTGCFTMATDFDSPYGDVSDLKGLISGGLKNEPSLPRVSLPGDVSNLRGTVKAGLFIIGTGGAGDLRGDLSGITGEVAFVGDVSNIYGTATAFDEARLTGDVSGLYGDITGIYGIATGITGNLDHCGLTAEDRATGLDIADLVHA